MLGGLFKRKDRKGRGQGEDVDDTEKLSDELLRGSPQGKGSSESLPLEQQSARSPPQIRPQRQTSKLQKAPPPGMAPRIMSPPGPREVISPTGRRDVVSPKPSISEQQSRTISPINRAPPSVAQISIPRAFEEPQQDLFSKTQQTAEVNSKPTAEDSFPIESPKESRRGMFSPIKDVLSSSSPSSAEAKPEKVKKAKQRMPMDEFDSDSSPDAEEQPDPILTRPEPIIQQEREGEHTVPEDAIRERLSESPIEVTAPEPLRSPEQSYFNQTPQDKSFGQQPQPYAQESPEDKIYNQQQQAYSQQSPEDRPLNQQQQRNAQPSPLDRSYNQQQQAYSQQSPEDRPLNQQQQRNAQPSPLDRSYNLQQQFQNQHTAPTHPPPLVNDTSSAEDASPSPTSPPSSPSPIEAPQEPDIPTSIRQETPASTTQSSTAPPWSDASLRAYLEDDSDIRDLLLLVHDKSDIKPAPPDHPVAKSLFKEENRRLGEMERKLDGMLGKVLERRKRGRVTPVR